MTRQGPNYHDDPRNDADNTTKYIVRNEGDTRRARLGSDMARVGLGLPEEYSLESKIVFASEESKRIAKFIENSDLQDPRIKNHLLLMIDAALQSGAITTDESAGLHHYIEHAEGFSDAPTSKTDVRSLQMPKGDR
jgi:hypothetical protein